MNIVNFQTFLQYVKESDPKESVKITLMLFSDSVFIAVVDKIPLPDTTILS